MLLVVAQSRRPHGPFTFKQGVGLTDKQEEEQEEEAEAAGEDLCHLSAYNRRHEQSSVS